MRWLPCVHRDREDRAHREQILAQAEHDVARLRERAEKVAGPLEARLRRNFWGDAAASIARKEV